MINQLDVSNLEHVFDELKLQYMFIYAKTDDLLQKYFEARSIKPSLPINYYDLASWIGIEIQYADLNYYRSRIAGERWMEIEKGDNNKFIIRIERTATVLEQRYAICYAIAYYISNLCINNVYLDNTKFYNNKEQFLINIITAFLIFPPKLTFKVIEEYLEKTYAANRKIEMNELMNVLSPANQMKFLDVVRALEHIKSLSYFIDYEKNKLKEILENKTIDDEVFLKKVEECFYEKNFAPQMLYYS